MERNVKYHKSISDLTKSYRRGIAAMVWLQSSVGQAKKELKGYKHIIALPCSCEGYKGKFVQLGKNILDEVEKEGVNGLAPLFGESMVNYSRIFTIAVKDVIWQEPDFAPFLQRTEFQFLRYIRNACSHGGEFYFGAGQERIKALKKLPIVWRGKEINRDIEGKKVFPDLLSEGDLFVLLDDISICVQKA